MWVQFLSRVEHIYSGVVPLTELTRYPQTCPAESKKSTPEDLKKRFSSIA